MLPPPQYNSMIMVAGETIPTRPDEISRSLPIPEYKIGWIIGKRGSYINQLAKKSGASISISDSSSKEYGTVWKYVQIRGSGRAVDRAKKLLHIRLERLEPRPVEEGEAPGHKVTNRFVGLGHWARAPARVSSGCSLRLTRAFALPCLSRAIDPFRQVGGEEGLGEEDLDGDMDGEGGGDVDGEGPMHGGYGGHPGHHQGHQGHPGGGYG